MSVHITKNGIRATGADAQSLFDALTKPKPEVPDMRVKVREWTGPEDVMPLHAICQPVVTEAQQCIRFQRQQLDRCAEALHYVLRRIKNEERVRMLLGAGTEVFEKLTAALADAKDRDVDAVRDYYIPGSAALHRARDEDEE